MIIDEKIETLRGKLQIVNEALWRLVFEERKYNALAKLTAEEIKKMYAERDAIHAHINKLK